jgi:hypothetical protein
MIDRRQLAKGKAHKLTRLIPKQLPHEHNWCNLKSLKQGNRRKTNISQRLVLTPTTQHIRNTWEGILVNYSGSGGAWFKVQEEQARHD